MYSERVTDADDQAPSPAGLSRAGRRQRTRAAILAAAQRLFGTLGFERTTIRAIADAAGITPGLVIQHYGSKERLFAEAAKASVDRDSLTGATPEQLPRAALSHVLDAFEDPVNRDSSVALLRSSLSHPQAEKVMRDDVIAPTQAIVADAIGGTDGELRAAILNACTLGLAISRYLLEVPALTKAERHDIEDVLLPALRTITHPQS